MVELYILLNFSHIGIRYFTFMLNNRISIWFNKKFCGSSLCQSCITGMDMHTFNHTLHRII